jgi:molybdenum cofactor cytidylyltransferase
MKFGPVPVDNAAGHILGHNVADASGRRALRKGKSLTAEDIELLRSLGRESVYVARLEPGDVDEDSAAEMIAAALTDAGLRLTKARTGRVNVYAEEIGVLRVDIARLEEINAGPGVALATLHNHSDVRPGRMVATLKVVPFALERELVERVVAAAAANGPTLTVDRIEPARVGIILSGSAAAEERVTQGYLGALASRFEELGAAIESIDYVPLDDEADEARLVETLERGFEQLLDLILLAGETAIQDRHDIAPRAIERAGGEITCYGAPVDPGNLLLLAFKGETAILGAPGCARSPKANIIDLVLPRLLAGERLDAATITALGHGGLLEDVPERPVPRSRTG